MAMMAYPVGTAVLAVQVAMLNQPSEYVPFPTSALARLMPDPPDSLELPVMMDSLEMLATLEAMDVLVVPENRVLLVNLVSLVVLENPVKLETPVPHVPLDEPHPVAPENLDARVLQGLPGSLETQERQVTMEHKEPLASLVIPVNPVSLASPDNQAMLETTDCKAAAITAHLLVWLLDIKVTL
jgi:hypothetical protein